MYFKLNSQELSQAFSEPLFYLHSSVLENRTAFLYIEANGVIVKKIDLMTVKYIREKNGNDFHHEQIKHIINKILNMERKPELRIRLLAGPDLIDQVDSFKDLRQLFANMDDKIALNVKFSSLPSPPAPINHNNHRRKRQADNRNNSSKQHQYKTTRECSDLRNSGYNSGNYTCCRETLSVTMEQLGWSHWILSPKVIEYKYCRGGCMCKLCFNSFIFSG